MTGHVGLSIGQTPPITVTYYSNVLYIRTVIVLGDTPRVEVHPFRVVLEVSSYLRMVVAGGSGRTSEERMVLVLDPEG